MKHFAVLSFFALSVYGCDRIETISGLQAEQKSLKDSANNINERMGRYLRKGIYDSAEIQKTQLTTVRERLVEIQSSMDSRLKKR